MPSFLIIAILVGTSILALSQAAAAQTLPPKRPAVAVQTTRAQPAQTQPTSARFARASMPASPCCVRTVLLGIAY